MSPPVIARLVVLSLLMHRMADAWETYSWGLVDLVALGILLSEGIFPFGRVVGVKINMPEDIGKYGAFCVILEIPANGTMDRGRVVPPMSELSVLLYGSTRPDLTWNFLSNPVNAEQLHWCIQEPGTMQTICLLDEMLFSKFGEKIDLVLAKFPDNETFNGVRDNANYLDKYDAVVRQQQPTIQALIQSFRSLCVNLAKQSTAKQSTANQGFTAEEGLSHDAILAITIVVPIFSVLLGAAAWWCCCKGKYDMCPRELPQPTSENPMASQPTSKKPIPSRFFIPGKPWGTGAPVLEADIEKFLSIPNKMHR